MGYKEFIKRELLKFGATQGIMEDGPNDLLKWEIQELKILFYYKETYGYDDSPNTSISKLYKTWIEDKVPTYKKMGLLTYLLLETSKGGRLIEYSEPELKKIYQTPELLIEALSKASVININKKSIPGNNTSNSLVRDKSRENKELLNQQLNMLKPNIIICGGRVTADSLYADLNFLSKTDYKFEKAEIVDNKIIAPYQHLSFSKCWYKKIHNYYLQITELTHGFNL